jgi:hypothetical protein
VSLTVLSVAGTLTAVSPDSVGGAEQILLEIDRGLVLRGHTSLVVASPDSKIAGTLIPTISVDGSISDETWRLAHDATRKAIAVALERYPVDLIHMHGVDFAEVLPDQGVTVLVTLQRARSLYKHDPAGSTRPKTYFNCVSRSQRRLPLSRCGRLPASRSKTLHLRQHGRKLHH